MAETSFDPNQTRDVQYPETAPASELAVTSELGVTFELAPASEAVPASEPEVDNAVNNPDVSEYGSYDVSQSLSEWPNGFSFPMQLGCAASERNSTSEQHFAKAQLISVGLGYLDINAASIIRGETTVEFSSCSGSAFSIDTYTGAVSKNVALLPLIEVDRLVVILGEE